MSDFAKFLSVNNIKRKDIASFLGVSGAYITQISSGERPLPADRLAQIKANAYGWDTTMLTPRRGMLSILDQGVRGMTPEIKLDKVVTRTMTDMQQSSHISYLQRKVDDQEKLIRELYQKIGTLEAMLDIAKEGK